MKKMLKLLAIQITFILFLLIVDLYVFRGYYSSKVIIVSESFPYNNVDYSSKLEISKQSDIQYKITYSNYSLFPKYFINYRYKEKLQKVDNTLFFTYLGRNIFPAFSFDYFLDFDCGTGLNYSSINPLESFEIEKSYNEIIQEYSEIYLLENMDDLFDTYKSFQDKSHESTDSVLNALQENVLSTDSVEIEYYFSTVTFISKNRVHVPSNRINVSLKDLLDTYHYNDSINHYKWD